MAVGAGEEEEVISKYNGTCHFCKQATKAGTDTYDLDSKISYHEDCKEEFENQPPSREQFELAAALGYTQFSWLDLRGVHEPNSSEPQRNDPKASDTASISDVRGGQEY